MKPTKHIAPFVAEMFSENSPTSSAATGSGTLVSDPETANNQAAPVIGMWCNVNKGFYRPRGLAKRATQRAVCVSGWIQMMLDLGLISNSACDPSPEAEACSEPIGSSLVAL